MWLDGITLPSPRVTSSSSAQRAHAKKTMKKAAIVNRRRWAKPRGVWRSAPARPSTRSASARLGRRARRRAAGPAAAGTGVAVPVMSGLRPDPAGRERPEHVVPGTVGDHPPAVQHDQPLDQGEERGAVRDQEQGLARQDLLEALLEAALGAVVHGAARLVEHQDRRVPEEGPGGPR